MATEAHGIAQEKESLIENKCRIFSLLTRLKLQGISKNSNFFVSARKHRAENRSVHGVHEDSSTELTPQSRKKCIY